MFRSSPFLSRPDPAPDYAAALRRAAILQAQDTSAVNPVCRAELLTHGDQTERAILFLHGFTNCPRQFQRLGQQFFALGYNVFSARLPQHGLADRLTPAQAQLKAEELIRLADEVVDIGRGLGRHLTLGGISVGGVAAAWAIQNRADVDQALILAPSFAFALIPLWLNPLAVALFSALPNVFIWWNSKTKLNTLPDYGYPRFSTRALTQAARVSRAVQRAARAAKPRGGKIILVTVGGDPAVDNRAAYAVADDWQRHGATLTRHEFDPARKLPHDLIDPNQPDQQVDWVYPKLVELVEGRNT